MVHKTLIIPSILSFTNIDPDTTFTIYLNDEIRGGLTKMGKGADKCEIVVDPGAYELRLSAKYSCFPYLCISIFIKVESSKKKEIRTLHLAFGSMQNT